MLVPLEEELAVVRTYLEIESLRLGDRIEGGADDRSGFAEGSNTTVLFPTAGRERGPTRTPFLGAGRADRTYSPSDRRVARDER